MGASERLMRDARLTLKELRPYWWAEPDVRLRLYQEGRLPRLAGGETKKETFRLNPEQGSTEGWTKVGAESEQWKEINQPSFSNGGSVTNIKNQGIKTNTKGVTDAMRIQLLSEAAGWPAGATLLKVESASLQVYGKEEASKSIVIKQELFGASEKIVEPTFTTAAWQSFAVTEHLTGTESLEASLKAGTRLELHFECKTAKNPEVNVYYLEVKVEYEVAAVEKTHTVSGSLSFKTTLPKETAASRTGSLSFKTSMQKTTTRVQAATLSFRTSLQRITVRAQAAALSFATTLTHQAEGLVKVITAALSFKSTAGKASERKQHGSLSFQTGRGAELPRETPFETGATLNMTVARIQAGAVSFKSALSKEAVRVCAAGLSFTSKLGKTTIHQVAGAVSFMGTVGKATVHGLAGTLSFLGNLIHRETGAFIKFIVSTLSFEGRTGRTTAQTRPATLTLQGARSTTVSRRQAATVSFKTTVARSTTKGITAVLSLGSRLNRTIPKPIKAALGFLGRLLAFSGVPPQPTPTRATIFGNRSRVTLSQNLSQAVLPPVYNTRTTISRNRSQASIEGSRSRVGIHG